jgi:hypothetical protein
VFRREITITGSFAEITSFTVAIAALRGGRVRTDGIITHRFALVDHPMALHALRHDAAVHKIVTHLYRAATDTGWYGMGAVLNGGIALGWVCRTLGATWPALYAAAAAPPPPAGGNCSPTSSTTPPSRSPRPPASVRPCSAPARRGLPVARPGIEPATAAVPRADKRTLYGVRYDAYRRKVHALRHPDDTPRYDTDRSPR